MMARALAIALVVGCLCGAAARDATILIGETTPSSRYAASASDPADLIITFGEALTTGDRVHIYLPLFRGASNTFGTFSASAVTEHPSPANPRQNGLVARNANQEYDAGLTSAYWDAPTETLRLVIAASNVSSVVLDSKYLRVGIAPSGRPNGKGPLPPAGGVRETWWYRTANFRVYSAARCQGAPAGRPGFPPEMCSSQDTQKTFTAASSSKMSTGGTRLFAHPQLGEAGTFEEPQFSYSVIEGSSTGMGETNCMTVSLIPSVSIMSDATTPAQITIGGFTTAGAAGLQESGELQLFASQTLCSAGIASMSKDLSGFFQSPADTPAPNKASWNKETGEVVLQLQAGQYMQAFQVLSFTFQLTNPSWLEEEKVPTIAATGRYCDQSHGFCADEATSNELNILPAPFQTAHQVLGTEPNQFEWKVIWQSSADPDVSAAIHITLSPNVDITNTDIIISNLCAPLSDSPRVNLTSNRDNFGDRINGVHPIELGSADSSVAAPIADWAEDEETLTIRAGSLGLEAGQVYATVIAFRTPVAPGPGCLPLVRTADFRAQYMTTETIGVINPARMNSFLIGQSSARPGQLNYLCVTLSPNAEITSGSGGQSKITISGLTGSLTPSSTTGQLYPCPRKLTDKRIDRASLTALTNTRYANDGFVFDQERGEVVVTIKNGERILKASESFFAIPLLNPIPSETTACATPTLEVSGSFAQGPVDFPAAPAAKRALEGGREDGDICALFVHRPQFTTRVIAQASSVAGADNQIMVTLRTNFDMVGATDSPATVTITGLTGSATPSSTNFLSAITSVEKRNFVKFSSAIWTQSTGTLILSLQNVIADCPVPPTENQGGGGGDGNECMRADYPYSFALTLKNPADAQEPPAEIRVGGSSRIGSQTATASLELMAFAAKKELKPLFVPEVGASFRTVSLGQNNAVPGAANTLCVTFSVWNAVAAGQAALTISGLTGFDTTLGPTLTMYGAAAGLADLPEALAGKFESERGGVANAFKWDPTSGVLSAELASGQALPANVNATLCAVLRNPTTPRPCHHGISVNLELKAEGKVLSMAGDAMGKEHPACAGFVETIRFPLASLRPSTNATHAVSTLMIELSPNVPISKGTITMAGMYGYKRISDDSVTGKIPIEVTKNGALDTATLEPEADWDGISNLVFTVKEGGPGILPAVTVPSGAVGVRAADVVVVKLQMRNGAAQAPYEVSVRASEYNMVPWAVDVGPEETRLSVVVVPAAKCFTYNDWVANQNADNGVSVAFADGADAARVVLPAETPFPEWLTICGEEQLPNTEATLTENWPFTRSQLSSTVLKLTLPERNAEDGVPLLIQSSVLRTVDPEVVPDIQRLRRRLLSSCPPGYETRIIPLGAPLEASCDCPSECADRATCVVSSSGEYGAFMIKEDLCAAPSSVANNAGKIVAIVAALFFVIVALTLFYLYRSYPELFTKDAAAEEEEGKVAIDVPPEDAKPAPLPPVAVAPPATRDVMLPPTVPLTGPEHLVPAPTPITEIYPAPPANYPVYPPPPQPLAGPTYSGLQDMDVEHVPMEAPNHMHAFSEQELAQGGLIEGHIPAPQGVPPYVAPISGAPAAFSPMSPSIQDMAHAGVTPTGITPNPLLVQSQLVQPQPAQPSNLNFDYQGGYA